MESRIHREVYVRFGGEYLKTYHSEIWQGVGCLAYYIFPIRYAGLENGIYLSKDQTCSTGDYRTIARNRTINKSRRAVRAALLPYVNAPLMVNPATGLLAPSKITAFKTLISDVLAKMQTAQEISGYAVTIDANQNVLLNDTLRIGYVLVPVGVATKIYVEEGLSLTTK